MSQEKEMSQGRAPAAPQRQGFGPRGMAGGLVEKPKSFKATMVKLIRYCRNYLPVILVSFAAAIGGTVMQIVGPDKLKNLTNEITKGLPAMVNKMPVVGTIDFSAVLAIVWALVFLYAGSTLLNFFQSYLMAGTTQKISRKMRTEISQKINRLPLKYFDRVSQGDVLSRVTNDVDTIGQSLNQSLGTLISSVTMLAGSLVMMFVNNWILALTAVGCSLFGFVLMIVIMARSQKYFSAQQNDLGAINGHVEEIYTGHNVVKVYNGGKA
ncbi:MAG: ABC transporter ATP-binding protein, partial [Christensenella sp.]